MDPPGMAYSFKCLEDKLIELFKDDYPQIQQSMDRLCEIQKTYEENDKLAETGFMHGTNSEIAGGVMMVLGIALSPFTLGASAALSAAGEAVAAGGLAGNAFWKSKISSMQATFKEEFKAELKKFQNKIFPMTGKMKDIDQRIKDILRDINNPNHEVINLGKYDTSDNELSHLKWKYDVGGLAAKISETVDLTVEMTGIVTQVESTNEFSDIWNTFMKLKTIMNAFNNNRNMLT